MTVVDDVSDEPSARSRSRTRKRTASRRELGEELGFQIFWRPNDAEKAARAGQGVRRPPQAEAGAHAFGRIAAQTAKQVLIQRVRDAERDLIFNEYKDRKGELITRHRPPLREGQQHHRRPRQAPRASCRSASRRRARRTAPATASSPT